MCENALVELPAGLDFSYAPGHRLRAGTGHGSRDVSPSIVSESWTTYIDHDDNRRRQARLAALRDLCMGGDPQWLHELSRTDGGRLLHGRRPIAIAHDVAIDVIVDSPHSGSSERSQRIYAAAKEAWQLNQVGVHTMNEYVSGLENRQRRTAAF